MKYKYFPLSSLVFLFLSSFFNMEALSFGSQAQLDTVNNKIVSLKKTIILKKDQQAQLEKELKTLDRQITITLDELTTLNREIAQKQVALSDSRKQLQELRKKNALQKDILGKQLCATYQLGEHEYLQLLLNQQNPMTVQRLMTYYSYISKARIETLANIQKTDEKIQQELKDIKKQIAQLAQLFQVVTEKKMSLEKNREKQHQVMKRLNHDIEYQSSQLKTYEADKKYLTALFKRLSQASARISKKALAKNALAAKKIETSHAVESSAPMVYKVKAGSFSQEAHHLIWPTRGKIRNKANSAFMGKQPGVMILAPEGQPVVSVFPGKVVFAGPLKGFGLLMILDHGQGYMTLYAHNQALYKKRGAMVNAGDLIAAVGHTGIFPQSGLYFEVRHFGRPVNPLQWLSVSNKG